MFSLCKLRILAVLTLACGILMSAYPVIAETPQTETEQDEVAKKEDSQKINVGAKLASCSEIIGRVERLICYDDIVKQVGLMSPEQSAREENILEKYGFWEVTQKKNAVGEEITYLKNNAAEEVKLRSGMSRIPTFVIMCKHGKTDVYIDWKSRITNYNMANFTKVQIIYQIDSGERRASRWELSTDRQAAFAPDPVSFIKELRNHDKLFIQMTPMNESMHTFIHDISGIDEVLKILIKRCYG